MPKFKTKLNQVEGMNATGIVVPAKIVDSLNAGKKPAVTVKINGKYSYRERVAVMGGATMIGVAKEHRDKAGIKGGDAIEVEIALDEAPSRRRRLTAVSCDAAKTKSDARHIRLPEI